MDPEILLDSYASPAAWDESHLSAFGFAEGAKWAGSEAWIDDLDWERAFGPRDP